MSATNSAPKHWYVVEVIVSGSKRYIAKIESTDSEIRAHFPRAYIRKLAADTSLVTLTHRP